MDLGGSDNGRSSGGILSWPIVGVLGATFKLREPLKLIEENRTSEALKKISIYKERNRKAGEFLENSGLGRWPILSRVERELSGVTGGGVSTGRETNIFGDNG